MLRKLLNVALLVFLSLASLALAIAEESKEASDKGKSPLKQSAEAGASDAKKDLDNMQGAWTVIAAERAAKKESDDAIKAMRFVVNGDSIVVSEGTTHPEEKATLKLNASVEPRSFDLVPVGVNGQKTVLGIYELKTGTLKMCWTMAGGERPQEFATKPGSNMAMLVLKRKEEKSK